MSVFKNPLSTPVGQRLNTAISHGQSAIDYPLVMEMCDVINETDHGPKDAKSAFKKLLFTNKDMGQVLQTLNILDICMKNGQKRFHRHIITKEFVLEMAKLAQTGKSSHSAVREKSLLLIQSWADSYRGKEDLGVAAEIYDQLKNNGVEFPAVNLDDMAPLHTPPSRQQSAPPPQENLPFSPPQRPSYPTQQAAYPPQQRPVGAPQAAVGRGDRNMPGEHVAKLMSEADVVQTNVQVLSDLLLNSIPGQDRREDIEFMQALRDTVKTMQARVMELLSTLPAFHNTEDVTARMLQLNDDINNVFTRHDRYVRQTQAANNPESAHRPIPIPEEPLPDDNISYPTLSATSPTQLEPQPQPQPPQPKLPVHTPPDPLPASNPSQSDAMALLLDFGTESTGEDSTPSILPLSSIHPPPLEPTQPATLTAAEQKEASSEVDEFDIFAKSRQNIYSSEFDTTSYSDTAPQPVSVNKALKRSISPEQAEGLTEWLATTDLTPTPKDVTAPGETSEAFDKFLAERARALPGKSSEKNKKNTSSNDIDDMFSL